MGKSVAASLPGYTSVARASEMLHLAPRSVRDLIYSGRLPSLRIGRLHYLRASDVEVERRRRLGLPLPRPRKPHAALSRAAGAEQPRAVHARRQPVDAEVRRQRAAERAALVSRWAERHPTPLPRVPFEAFSVETPANCEACGKTVRRGLMVRATDVVSHVCTTCGRRALLEWADQRRLEALAARRLSENLGRSSQSLPAPSPSTGEMVA